MSHVRIEIMAITGGAIVWIGILIASWQGKLGVSGLVSDGLLAFLGLMIAYRSWRLYRHRGRKNA